MTPLKTVLDALRAHGGNPRQNGSGWNATCPAHDDKHPSLSVGEGSDGRALATCHAGNGCTFPDIAAALDLPESAFFPPKERPERQIIDTYPYVDEHGQVLYEAVRFTPKDFRQRRPNGNGGWDWKLGDTRRVLYRLPQVVDAIRTGADIFIPEGERDVHAIEMASLDAVATTSPMGAGKWRAEYAEMLRGAARVFVIADRDTAGRAHARQVADSLDGLVGDVVVVEAREGNDVSDHLAAGYTLDDLEVVQDEDAEPVDEPPADGEPGDDSPRSNRLADNSHTNSEVVALPPLTPLVDELLFMPGESVVYSPPKVAKTFWAIDLAECVASGQDFMGRRVRQGLVAFVAAEGAGGLGARVRAWHDYQGRADYVEGVTFITVTVNLMDPAAVTELCEYLQSLGVILTIIDTLARCTAGAEENSARDMGRVVEAIDKIRDATGGHVEALHHAGKDPSKGMRGSSALLGAVDTVIELSGDSKAIRVEVTAQKDSEAIEPWWCQLQPVGASAVIVPVAGVDMLTGAQTKTLRALRNLAPEDCTSTKWEAMAKDEGVAHTAYYGAKKALLKSGKVTCDDPSKRGALYQTTDGDDT